MNRKEFTLLKPSQQCKFYRYRIKGDPKRSALSTGCVKKYEAINYVKSIIKKKQSCIPTNFGDYAAKFFIEQTCPYVLERKCAHKNISLSWIKARRGQSQNYLLPQFQNFQLVDLDYTVVNPWISKLPGISHRLKNEILRTLTIILNFAQRDEIIQDHKKYQFVKFVKKDSKKKTALTIQQINSLFPKNDNELLKIWDGNFNIATLSYVMATTGIRTGEARAMRWCDVYWDETGLIICHTISNDNELEPTKTRKNMDLDTPDRVIPLIPQAMKMLNELRNLSENKKPDDFIFCGKGSKKWIGRSSLNKQFKKIMNRQFPNLEITPYCFRHSFKQTFSVLLGELLTESLLGHSPGSVSVTYNQASKEMMLQRLVHLNSCRNIIDQYLG